VGQPRRFGLRADGDQFDAGSCGQHAIVVLKAGKPCLPPIGGDDRPRAVGHLQRALYVHPPHGSAGAHHPGYAAGPQL